jgi:GNAT superfamily N-acetyltransferase
VLEAGSQLLGVAWLGPYKNKGLAVQKKALLRRLFLRPEAQGQGGGSRLLDWAEGRAIEGGAEKLELWCLEVNRAALAFYAGRGYRPDGKKGIYQREGRKLVKIRYRKLLPGHPERTGHDHGRRGRKPG